MIKLKMSSRVQIIPGRSFLWEASLQGLRREGGTQPLCYGVRGMTRVLGFPVGHSQRPKPQKSLLASLSKFLLF